MSAAELVSGTPDERLERLARMRYATAKRRVQNRAALYGPGPKLDEARHDLVDAALELRERMHARRDAHA